MIFLSLPCLCASRLNKGHWIFVATQRERSHAVIRKKKKGVLVFFFRSACSGPSWI